MSNDTLYYIGVKAIIRDSQDRILLLQIPRHGKATTYWDLPGGRVKEGEDLTRALQREIEEETGIRDLIIEQPLGTMLTPIRLKAPGINTAGLLFVVYRVTSTSTIASTEPGVHAHWLAPQKALELLEIDPNIPSELIAEIRNIQ